MKTLEIKAAAGADCAACKGEGWPAVMVANAPTGSRPPEWRVGCRAGGRVSLVSWIGVGANPTAQQVREFLEAI